MLEGVGGEVFDLYGVLFIYELCEDYFNGFFLVLLCVVEWCSELI